MLTFPRTAQADPAEIESVFKEELAAMAPDELPLQRGMAHGSVADGERLSAMVIRADIDADHVRIRAGLFFSSVVAGCACHNDPTPMAEEAEYCEASFEIERPGGSTVVRLLD
ncbi:MULTISPECIES: hypothetical protein [unclassified Guyparkeria]|uniref:hypothetical protein n=1 Tax=unclassified Guyparkeria TaxID=2626246 RepID=UPI0007337721|nr:MULTISPECIES: hypothetical protein [unclassified Guyparkeria]KTG16334.1 hypothetical protein AUR63_02965 [Guyparkeria sp. XI15]OAE85274.1 hypothetical protein AWR35_02970 [Guyparkeria sp. WRN-7]